jgi:hypothetical protein
VRARLILLAASSLLLGFAAIAPADEPPRRTLDMSRTVDAGAQPSIAEIAISRTPADPPPLVERSQWVFDLRWDQGDVWLLGTRPLELPAAQPTPRVMGRFALELFEGAAIIERVRFDFPLLGPPEPDAGISTAISAAISISRKLRTRIGVIFPATSRGTRLELVDRATDKRWSVPWPPPPATPDAGPSQEPVAVPLTPPHASDAGISH